jgi:hypothetical protein
MMCIFREEWAVGPGMVRILMIAVMAVASSAALGLTVDEAKVRLEKASNIAKLQNDPRKLEEVEAAGKQAKRALVGGDEVAAEKAVQAGEVAAGLDAGGKTMNGIRIYSPAPEMLRKQRELGAALKQAMAAEDVAAVKRIVEQSAETLGEELGKPENALPGRRAKAMHPVSEAENAKHLRRCSGERQEVPRCGERREGAAECDGAVLRRHRA